jgi:hypothetical protein
MNIHHYKSKHSINYVKDCQNKFKKFHNILKIMEQKTNDLINGIPNQNISEQSEIIY